MIKQTTIIWVVLISFLILFAYFIRTAGQLKVITEQLNKAQVEAMNWRIQATQQINVLTNNLTVVANYLNSLKK